VLDENNKNDVMMMLFALKTTLRALRNIYAMFTTEKKQIIYLYSNKNKEYF
jgi:hypothetical protein